MLRKPTEADVEEVVALANNAELAEHTYLEFPHPFEKRHAETVFKNPRAFIIQDHKSIMEPIGPILGMAGYTLGNDVFSCTAEAWLWLGREYWGLHREGHSVAELAYNSLFGHIWAFERGVSRIQGGVFSGNTRNVMRLLKMGIRLEGVRRSCLRDREGRLQDELMFAVLREEEGW